MTYFTEKELSVAAADSTIVLSLYVDRKSTTFSEVVSTAHPVLYDHIPLLHIPQPKKEMKKLQQDQKLRVYEYVEVASFRSFLVQQETFPREQKNPLSFVSVVRFCFCNCFCFLFVLLF